MVETRFRRQQTDGINAPTGGRSLVLFVVDVVVIVVAIGVFHCIVFFIRDESFSCLALLGFVLFSGIFLFVLPFSLLFEIFRVLMLNELLIFLADGDLGVNQFNNTVVQFQCQFFGLIEVLRHLFFQDFSGIRDETFSFFDQEFGQLGFVFLSVSHDSFDLILCKSQIGIDLLLVNFVSLGKREHRNETKDQESESVEPSANVSHNPEEDAEFDGVDHVFDQDETTEFADVGGHVRRDDFSVFLGLLRADGQVHLQVLSERMAFIALLNGSQSPLVDGKGERHRQHCEGDVRDDREHGEDGEGDEEEEGRSGDDGRLLDVLPVDQIHDSVAEVPSDGVFNVVDGLGFVPHFNDWRGFRGDFESLHFERSQSRFRFERLNISRRHFWFCIMRVVWFFVWSEYIKELIGI